MEFGQGDAEPQMAPWYRFLAGLKLSPVKLSINIGFKDLC